MGKSATDIPAADHFDELVRRFHLARSQELGPEGDWSHPRSEDAGFLVMTTPAVLGRHLSTKLEIFDLELAHQIEFGPGDASRLTTLFAALRADLLRMGVDRL